MWQHLDSEPLKPNLEMKTQTRTMINKDNNKGKKQPNGSYVLFRMQKVQCLMKVKKPW
jgi:hypothetical protein